MPQPKKPPKQMKCLSCRTEWTARNKSEQVMKYHFCEKKECQDERSVFLKRKAYKTHRRYIERQKKNPNHKPKQYNKLESLVIYRATKRKCQRCGENIRDKSTDGGATWKEPWMFCIECKHIIDQLNEHRRVDGDHIYAGVECQRIESLQILGA